MIMYTATIVGGGAISCGYDSPDDEHILTHIHGIFQHPKITLDAIVDINTEHHRYIREKWGEGFDLFTTLENAIAQYKSDLYIIATPTDTHYKIIEELLLFYTPKLIICEKPIVSNLDEFYKLNDLIENYDTKIITHFTRRFDPGINKVKNLIANNAEKIFHFYGTFAKDLIHNGSHMIDLISLLIGEIKNIEIIEKRICDDDIFGLFLIKTNKCNGIISNIDYGNLSLFEFTVYTDCAKVEIIGANQDIVINYIEDSKNIPNFRSFSSLEKFTNTMSTYGFNTLDYVINLIENNEKYKQIWNEQYLVNELIFKTKEKMLRS